MKIGSIIHGKTYEDHHESLINVVDPYRKETIAELIPANPDTASRAVNDSYEVFHETMKHMPAYERAAILRKAADLLEKRRETFVETITQEAGKPVKHSRAEVDRALQVLRFASELVNHFTGEVLPMDAASGGENRWGFVVHEPLGVIGAITPFNFPLNLVLHKVAPAIATGNCVVLKPAEKTPISSYKLAELFHDAGLPPGVLNVVQGGGEVGEALVNHDKVHKISFTGSLPVGREIRAAADLKKVTLELGSNSPNLIFADADLEYAAEQLVTGAFAFSGQACISAQRIYIQDSCFEQFLQLYKEKTMQLTTGDPREESTDIGPMITEEEAERAFTWIEDAKAGGAVVETGGTRDGAVLQPTIMTNVERNMKVIAEEVFAPIVSVVPFSTTEEAVQLANDSIYGLQAGVFTQNINRALQVAQQLEMGGVWINEISTYRQDNHPYGGVKQSGIGKEGVKYAMEDTTNVKFIGINHRYSSGTAD
ncbi:acyl-CoA reductase-like NAD-dependent aldehyde dehydrogenase [Salsuginibacillus halophilus]|uniref:3-sulfolactaldehyde dehydrogenase n=1 Tax=Salsuginibacillus halophilus TaxID=517424 RepID=A0A2P8HYJ9_9BACI|nr:aldehyde dehydrogenase family protein [Salsuginibacillus halophilus]PSL51289.1 acyl-CoA reductase-like NAD-dependent aldehyde dehydrogenase [Salsuginibacillus halophilus]